MSPKQPSPSSSSPKPVTEAALWRRTMRTTAVLVSACVLFVGLLSVIAVTITSRAVGAGAGVEPSSRDARTGETAAKKPLPI